MNFKKQSHPSGIKNGSGSILSTDSKGNKKSANPFYDYRYAFTSDSHPERDSFTLDLRYYDAFDEFNPDITDKERKGMKRFHSEFTKIMKLIAKAPMSIEGITKETEINLMRVICHIEKLHSVFKEVYVWTDKEKKKLNRKHPAHPIDWFYGYCPEAKKVVALWYSPGVKDYCQTLPKWFRVHGPTPINKPMN